MNPTTKHISLLSALPAETILSWEVETAVLVNWCEWSPVCAAWLCGNAEMLGDCAIDSTWQSGAAAGLALKRRRRTAKGKIIKRAFISLSNIPKV
jgi:hypothetical protein